MSIVDQQAFPFVAEPPLAVPEPGAPPAFSPDGKWSAVAEADWMVRVRETAGGREVTSFKERIVRGGSALGGLVDRVRNELLATSAIALGGGGPGAVSPCGTLLFQGTSPQPAMPSSSIKTPPVL